MALAQPFSKAPPIILFGGQGSPNLFSATSSKKAQENAERSLYSAQLLSRWHAVFLEECQGLDQASQQCLKLNTTGFLRQRDLLEIPRRLHNNPLIQSITICLYQLLHYAAELDCGYLSKIKYSVPPILEATGICSGLLTAAVAAASKDVSSVVRNGVEALRLAFSVGAQAMFHTQNYEDKSDSSSSWCLIATGLKRAEILDALESFNQKTGGGALRVSAVSTPTMISVTGPPDGLIQFQQQIAPMAVTKFAHIHGWYHGGEPLEATLQEVLNDVERRNIKFPGVRDLQVPIRSTFDGSLLDCKDSRENLALWVLEHMFLKPVDWVETIGSLYSSLEARVNQDQEFSQDVLCFGPSTESLFLELKARDRKTFLRLVDLSPFRAAINGYDLSSTIRDEDIAIVGMGVHLPKGHGVEELWETLTAGLSAVSEIPDSRFDVSTYNTSSEVSGQRSMTTRYGAFLDTIWEFDNEFFGISPREARSMDPQQRVLLHTSQAALDDAGYAPNSSPTFSEASFGCYVGLATGDYTDNLRDDIDVFYSTGTLRAFHSGRISFTHNFSGPSITTDTACSSSLVSIYHACRALRNGDCTAALAGGVNTISSPDMYLGLSRGHFLSSSGGCKPFDASADGYCRAEGCAMFVLKRLSCAVAENDHIHAVIKSVEVNQSGAAASITHPHSKTQHDLFQKTLQNAGVDPATVDVVEAHGTGTAAGDPCELASLRSAFGSNHSPTHPLVVSSIKGNIGHCEAASGAAGLAKLLLAIRHRIMPAQASFQSPNPRLKGLDDGIMVIPTENRPWKPSTEPCRALLNNFGAAGSNGALLLEEFQNSSPGLDGTEANRSSFVFSLSAKDSNALSRMITKHKEFVRTTQMLRLADVCYTATARRAIYSHRISLCCSSLQELMLKLENLQPETLEPNHALGPIVFVFSGQGSLYTGMGRGLFEQSPRFRQTMLHCDAVVRDLGFASFMPFIQSASDLTDTDHELVSSQCACFSLEYSLASLLMSWNIIPDFVIGHSLGEYAALVISGALTVEGGLRVVATRARLMAQNCLPASSGMSACKLSPSDANNMIESDERLSDLVVACRNSDDDCVIAGPLEKLNHLESICKTREIKTSRLRVPFAYHSPAMEPIYDQLKNVGLSVKWHDPKIPVGSDVYGRLLRFQDLGSDYFARHARQQVRFNEVLRDIESHVDIEGSVFFEIGPHPITLPMVRSQFGSERCTLLSTVQRGKDDWSTMNESLAKVALVKTDLDWRAIFEGSGAKVISLPGYPLQGETFWVPFKEPKQVVTYDNTDWTFRETSYALLRRFRVTNPPNADECYELATTMANLNPLIAGHVVGGVAICPASVYHELILEAMTEFIQLEGHQRPVVSNLQFPQPLMENAYANSDPVYVRAWRRDEKALQFGVCLRDPSQFEDGAVCTADVTINGTDTSSLQGVKEKALALRQISYLKNSEGRSTFQPQILYNSIFTRVVTYSEIYQTLIRFTVSSTCLEGEGTFTLPEKSRIGQFVTNPMFLDTLFHAAGFIANLRVSTGEICICGRIETVEVPDQDIDMSQEFKIYCSLVDEIKGIFLADSYALDASGNVVAVARGMEFKRLRLKTFQNVLQSAVDDSKEMQDTHTPDLVRDSTCRSNPETSSSAGPNTPPTPKDDPESISTIVLRTVSDASGFPESRLQSSVPLENLGIDSMMHIEITAKLQKAFPGKTIDHRNLSNCKTIQALEDVLQTALAPSSEAPASTFDGISAGLETDEQDKASMGLQHEREMVSSACTPDNPMEIQHSASEKTPVFLIHDGSGQVSMYVRMERTKDRKIYAFRDINGFSGVGKRRGLSVMASEYASSILTLETPSVILGGWSFGGVVALEVAKQLSEAGVLVKGLVLIDSPYPGNHQPLPKQIASAVVNNMDGLKEPKSKSRTLEAFERHASMLGAYTPPTSSNLMTVALRSKEAIPTQEIYGVDYPWLSSQKTRDDAIDNWRRLVGGRLETLTIPGNHFEAFDEYHIAQTSAQFALACEIIDNRS